MNDEQIEKARDSAVTYLRTMNIRLEDAEDFAQDAVLKIYQMDLAGTLQYNNINCLAITIAKNIFLDYKKAEKYKNRPQMSYLCDCKCLKNIEDEEYNENIDNQYDEYLSILKERDQNIVKMRLHGLNHTQIGEIMGISAHYSRLIYSKSLTKIKKYIKYGK